jgi:hypothetical protein
MVKALGEHVDPLRKPVTMLGCGSESFVRTSTYYAERIHVWVTLVR